MNRSAWPKLAMVAALFALAATLFVRFLRDDGGVSETLFFYDLSERKLFAAPRTLVPPIKGLNDGELDAVRAMVVSTNGDCSAKTSWHIAYLEKCSPDLKQQMEAAQASGTSPPMGRGMAQAHRFVKRVADTEWFPLTSPEGERIVAEWLAAGANGSTPVPCSP